MIYVTQRHFHTQRANAEVDARLDADLRTAVRRNNSGVKYQPQWIGAIYDVLVNKQSNIQFGVEVVFRYSCPVVRSPNAATLFADSWTALSPVVDFVLE